MNKQRRKQLEDVVAHIDQAKVLLEYIINDEQEAYDNMPESLQESERGEQMSEYIDTMQEAFDGLDEYSCNLFEIVEG